MDFKWRIVNGITFEKYVKEVEDRSCKRILKIEFLKHVCRLVGIMSVIQMKFFVTYSTENVFPLFTFS